MGMAKRENAIPHVGGVEIGVSISGERPVVRVREAESTGSRAHAEMERAVRRGVCVMLADERHKDGLREQKTAWLMADGNLVFSTWYQAPDGEWTRGASYSVNLDGVASLAELLERNGL